MPKHKYPTDPLQKRWVKLRSAIRNVWRYDISHKQAIDKGSYSKTGKLGKWFRCAICKEEWPIELASPDHVPELGSFNSWDSFFDWTRRCFDGPTFLTCKPCHKRKKKPSVSVEE